MSPTKANRAIHAFLSRQVTKGVLLSYVEQWQHDFPAWTWRYEHDALQPGDWVLDLVAPEGQTYSFFLHPDGDVLRLLAPLPLPA